MFPQVDRTRSQTATDDGEIVEVKHIKHINHIKHFLIVVLYKHSRIFQSTKIEKKCLKIPKLEVPWNIWALHNTVCIVN